MWTFSPDDVKVALVGTLNLDGFVNGEFIRITKDEPVYTLRRVASGGVARRKVVSDTYSIVFNLQAGSKSNDLLYKLHRMDVLTETAKFPLLIRDKTGSSYFFSTTCWIESVPDKAYSTDEVSNSWLLRCADGINNVGGNEALIDIETALAFAASSIPYVSDLLERLQ